MELGGPQVDSMNYLRLQSRLQTCLHRNKVSNRCNELCNPGTDAYACYTLCRHAEKAPSRKTITRTKLGQQRAPQHSARWVRLYGCLKGELTAFWYRSIHELPSWRKHCSNWCSSVTHTAASSHTHLTAARKSI